MNTSEVWPPLLIPPTVAYEDLINEIFNYEDLPYKLDPKLHFQPPLLRATTFAPDLAASTQKKIYYANNGILDKTVLSSTAESVVTTTLKDRQNIFFGTVFNFTISPLENCTDSLVVHDAMVVTNTWVGEWPGIVFAALCCLILVLGVLGNLSVIASLCRLGGKTHPGRHSAPLISMVVADIVIAVIYFPISTTYFLLPSWQAPPFLCPVTKGVQTAAHGASTFSLSLLALDRFLTVRKPKLATKAGYYSSITLLAMWLLMLLISLPRAMFSSVHYPSDDSMHVECTERWPSMEVRVTYYCLLALLLYIIPCILVGFFHTAVAISLKKRISDETKMHPRPRKVIIMAKDFSVTAAKNHRVIAASSSEDTDNVCIPKDFQLPLDGVLEETPVANTHRLQNLIHPSRIIVAPSKNMKTIIKAHRRLRAKKKSAMSPVFAVSRNHSVNTRRKLANLLVSLVVIFSICWLPYVVALIAWSLKPSLYMNRILALSMVLAHSNSAINPIIYWLMNRSFLSTFRRLFINNLEYPSERMCTFSCVKCSHFLFRHRPRPNSLWINNSSTNLDALGPFNPKYTKPIAFRPQQSRCTSHYFH